MQEPSAEHGRPTIEMSRLKRFIRTRRSIPKETTSYSRGASISDGGWTVGEVYLTSEGNLCKVLTHELVFMGYTSLISFSNGAIRYAGPNDTLFEVLDWGSNPDERFKNSY